MITELKWHTFQQCHFTTRQIMMWKAVNNQIAVHIPDHIHRPTEQSRGHQPHTYINVSSKTDSYKFSFYPRTTCCWNLLPESIVMAENAGNFKSAIWKSIDTERIKVVSPKDPQNRPRLGSRGTNPSLLIIKVDIHPVWPRALRTL